MVRGKARGQAKALPLPILGVTNGYRSVAKLLPPSVILSTCGLEAQVTVEC